MGGWRCGYLRRSREGSDYTHHQPVLREPCISIHAPAKGATACKRSTFARAPPHFNPRSREGSDSTLCGGNLFLICISIHAPAKGATSDASSGSIGRSYFNPRSREGSDQSRCERKQRRWKFQSTLPRRERRRSMQSRAADGDFNPRSREGSDIFSRSLTIC